MTFSQKIEDANTPKEYWAWTDDGKLVPLGLCASFNEASEKEPPNTHWIFTRDDLMGMLSQINKEFQNA